MIDVHSHILPEFDDGAENADTAVEMLRVSSESGIDSVISTSHCYPRANQSIIHFLERREKALEKLNNAKASSGYTLPEIILGCEVNLYSHITEYKDLHKLCIADTNYILIEMPYEQWKEWMTEEVYKLTIMGFKPIMAHIERFMYQEPHLIENLMGFDITYQVNAESFLNKRMNKVIKNLIKNGKVHFIGSDMHNLKTRPQNMALAKESIIKNFGEDFFEFLQGNAVSMLNNKKTDSFPLNLLKKKSFLENLFS